MTQTPFTQVAVTPGRPADGSGPVQAGPDPDVTVEPAVVALVAAPELLGCVHLPFEHTQPTDGALPLHGVATTVVGAVDPVGLGITHKPF
jgi:hypothetical protein